MRRAVIAACLVATTLAPASVAAARPHARYVVTSHGDRIPRGADRRLHRHGVFAHNLTTAQSSLGNSREIATDRLSNSTPVKRL